MAMIMLSLLTFALVGVLTEGVKAEDMWASTCPDAGLITPCVCTVIDKTLTEMNCSAIASEEELAKVFSQKFTETGFFTLHIEANHHLKVLREGALGNTTFQHIRMYNGALEKVEEGALSASTSTVTHLDFFNNNLKSFPYHTLPSLTRLEYLDLQMNSLQGFPVLSSATLTTLYLSFNPLGELPGDAFINTPALSYINLRKTGIKEVPAGTFTGLPMLSEVDLWANEVHELVEGVLETSSQSWIYLANNNISSIAPNFITGITYGFIDVSSNRLRELKEKVWHPLLDQAIKLDASRPQTM
ncbi:Oplophorus-luciferin 2-monooxygenase non-catalytic subunit-like 7 [Homarus americanus]|uniref:Oplophorus-luciferin 2-monooxygenase non-catalytic subunit-like 7 n=1 Tax=Homarus americanus TaxID=6706 RepID=A0A8J5N8V5_HOMAM|nr:Oplophorus-luciferin 2-monooxygenase non-catalytic subunit-like 7 [Homarus americanus]